MIRIAVGVGSVLVIVVMLALTVGWALPVKHQASREATFSLPPDSLYAIIAGVAQYPSWRPDVQRVERLPDHGGLPSYRETSSDGVIPYVVEESTPSTRLVTRIADPSLPFGGRWTYELHAVPGGTRLRITEDGEVYNPVFRFMSRFIFTHYRTIDRYLRDLAVRVGN